MTFDPEIVGRVPVHAPVSLGPDTGFAENFAAAYDDFVLTNAFLARENAVSRRYEDIIEDIHKQTGKRLRNPFYEHLGQQPGFDPESETSLLRPGGRRLSKQPLGAFHDQFADEAAKAGAAVPTFEEINRQADELSVAASKTAADISARSTLGGSVGSVLGNISGAVIDPPNLASMAVGSPASAGFLRFMIIEGLINAGVEAVQQPVIQSRRAELGLRSGFVEGLGNVAFAAGGGFLLSGAIRGGAAGLRRILGSDDGVLPRVDRDAPRTEAQDEALAFQERVEEMRETSPFADEALGDFEHQTRLDAAMEALNQGRLPTLRGRPISAVSRAALLTDPATRVDFKALTDDAVLQSQIDEIVAGVAEQRQLLARQIFDEQGIRTPETEIAERIADLERQLDTIDTDRPLRAFVESFGPAEQAIKPSGPKPVFRMSSDEVEVLLNVKSLSDREKLVKALGSEELADEFTRLDRKANSTDPRRADEGIAEFDEKFGDPTPEQERLIFGIGETELQVNELRDISRALRAVDNLKDETNVEVAGIIANGMRLVKPEQLDILVRTGTAEGHVQEAFIRIFGGLEELKRRGLSNEKIDSLILDAMEVRGFSRFDAAEVLSKFLDRDPAQQASNNLAIAQLAHEAGLLPEVAKRPTIRSLEAQLAREDRKVARAGKRRAAIEANRARLLDDDTVDALEDIGVPVEGRDIGDVIADLRDRQEAAIFETTRASAPTGTSNRVAVARGRFDDISDEALRDLDGVVETQARSDWEGLENEQIFIEDSDGNLVQVRVGDLLEDIDNSDRVLTELVDCAGSAA